MLFNFLLNMPLNIVCFQAWDREKNRVIFSPVAYWLHAESDQPGIFLRLSTDSNENLLITGNHNIFRSITCDQSQIESVMASDLATGDCLIDINRNFVKINAIDQLEKQGIFAPVTREGTVVVNGIVCSCFANQGDGYLQKILHSYIMFMRNLVDGFVTENVVSWLFGAKFGSTSVPKIYLALDTLQKYTLS